MKWIVNLPVRLMRAFAWLLKWLLQKLGWMYLGALLFAFAALGAFAWLATEVLEQEFVTLNNNVLESIHGYSDRTLDSLMVAITHLGDPLFIIPGGLIAIGLFVWQRHLVDAATIATVLIGGFILSTGLKMLFGQERPTVIREFVSQPSNYSFPSGHALITLCFFGFFAIWLLVNPPRRLWRYPAALMLLVPPLFVGMSRMYLGVHWPTDVAAGFLLAIFWLAVCYAGRHWMKQRLERQGPPGDELLETEREAQLES